MNSDRNFTAVSLFCGCGGLDLGFKQQGFDLIYACDSDPAAVAAYARNVDERVHLRDVSSEQFHDEVDSLGQCDVVLGGFPCQGFSKAGPKQEADPRNTLYVEMKRAVERLRPSIFIAENVDGLSQNFGGSYVARIAADFSQIGYRVDHRIVDAAAYGLAQYRRRIVFVGVKRDMSGRFDWPRPTHSVAARNGEFKLRHPVGHGPLWSPVQEPAPALPSPRTIRDAIGDLLELESRVADHKVTNAWPEEYQHIFRAVREGQKLCNVRHAETSVYTWKVPEVFGETSGRERAILGTISKNRRHRKYGDIPNGNPLSVEVIESLSGLTAIKSEIDSLLKKGYLKEKSGKYDLLGAMFCSGLFKRPHWEEPSPTVLTVFDNPRYFLHPLRDRPFSIRECARLQGFPDDFTFTNGSKLKELRSAYRLIGNAVPPPLAALLAQSARKLLTPALAATGA